MSAEEPKISVLMSVYNAQAYLDEAIESIRNQTFRDFEFIIINDGSTDDSASILDRHASEDDRIYLIKQENKGLIAALNLGISEARAPLLARMDADDVAYPERLEKQYQRISTDSELGLLGSHVQVINEKGDMERVITYPIGDDAIKDSLIYGNPFAHSAIVTRTELIRELKGYRDFYKYCEDYDMWLRISEVMKIDNLDETLLKYRWHEYNISKVNRNAQISAFYLAQAAWKMRSLDRNDPTEIWGNSKPNKSLLNNLPLPESEKWNIECRWINTIVDEATQHEMSTIQTLVATLPPPSDELLQDMPVMYVQVLRNLIQKAWKFRNRKIFFWAILKIIEYSPFMAMKNLAEFFLRRIKKI